MIETKNNKTYDISVILGEGTVGITRSKPLAENPHIDFPVLVMKSLTEKRKIGSFCTDAYAGGNVIEITIKNLEALGVLEEQLDAIKMELIAMEFLREGF